MNDTQFSTLLISLLPGIGASRYWTWIDIHRSPEAVLITPPSQLPKLTGAAKAMLLEYQQVGNRSKLFTKAQKVINKITAAGAEIITHHDEDYPKLLKEIHRPPPVLYIRGNKDLLHLPQIGMVGTRHPTYGGRDNARIFSNFLAAAGFTITSGLASGVDGICHRGALDIKGKTLAVMATGIDQVYPTRHQKLTKEIVENGGLLVTEFHPGTPPQAANFPQRNRIISGLSLGVLVIEAAVKSGSLITARYAVEQNREVFSIPGSIQNPQSKGCHMLIKQGAHLVETGEDIIEHLGGLLASFAEQSVQTKHREEQDLTQDERYLLANLGDEPTNIDTVIERCNLPSDRVTSTLLTLELKGQVKQTLWGYEKRA